MAWFINWLKGDGTKELVTSYTDSNTSKEITFPENTSDENKEYEVVYTDDDGCTDTAHVTVEPCDGNPCTVNGVIIAANGCDSETNVPKIKFTISGTFNEGDILYYKIMDGSNVVADTALTLHAGVLDYSINAADSLKGKTVSVTCWYKDKSLENCSWSNDNVKLDDCSPCIIFGDVSSEAVEFDRETKTIVLNYLSSYETDYLKYSGTDGEVSLYIRNGCGVTDSVPVWLYDGGVPYYNPILEEANCWFSPDVADGRIYFDRLEYENSCPPAPEENWQEACLDPVNSPLNRSLYLEIYVGGELCETLHVIQKKYECGTMTYKHTYTGNVFDNLPRDDWGNLKKFFVRAQRGGYYESLPLGHYILEVHEPYDCSYHETDFVRTVDYSLNVFWNDGSAFDCAVVNQYPRSEFGRRCEFIDSTLTIPICGDNECLKDGPIMYPRNLHETIHPSNQDSFVRRVNSYDIYNVYILYDGYYYKLGGDGDAPNTPNYNPIYTNNSCQGKCLDCIGSTEEDCGVVRYTYCTAVGDEAGFNPGTSAKDGPKRVFKCTVTFRFTLKEETINVNLDLLCEGDNCEGCKNIPECEDLQ